MMNFKSIGFLILTSAISLLVIFLFHLLERNLLNIDKWFHPDSLFYYNNFKTNSYLSFNLSLTENVKNFINNIFTGNLYFSLLNLINELTNFIKQNKILIIYEIFGDTFSRNIVKFNVIIYLFTNLFIAANYLSQKKNLLDLKNLILLILILFLPYKLHLTVNVLKDSLIISVLTLLVLYPNFINAIMCLVIGTSIRYAFPIYLIALINRKIFNKNNLILLLIILVSLLFFFYNNFLHDLEINKLIELLKQRQFADMGGRDFDKIPNFQSLNIITASILKFLIWPVLFLTGGFVFFSDSYLFFILGFEILIIQLIFFWSQKKIIFSVSLLFTMGIISLWVNTYSSFFRYCYPVFYMTVLTIFFYRK